MFPKESVDPIANQPPMTFPLPPPPIPMPLSQPQLSPASTATPLSVVCGQVIPPSGAVRPPEASSVMSEQQIAMLEEELMDLELCGINHDLDLIMDEEDRVFQRSNTSSMGSGARIAENGHSSQSQVNHLPEFDEQQPAAIHAHQKTQMVDNFCQTMPSKEKELLMKIMNNKDLFTACMVKFPDLVFEICRTESLLPSV